MAGTDRRSLSPVKNAGPLAGQALLLVVLVVACLLPPLARAAAPAATVDLVLFYGRGCPYCAAMREFLTTMRQEHPQLRVREYEVYFDGDNARLFQQLADAYDVEITGVPTAFLGDGVIVGFSEDMRAGIAQAIEQCIAEHCSSPLRRVSGPARLPMLTLTAVAAAAAVDAINPCAFAVLILLITAVLGAGERRRVLYAGLAFSLAIFISYYLMGVGLYSAVAAAGVTQALYVAVGVLAILIGLFNLKDYLWYGKWFVMEVPLSWRPALKRLTQGVTSVPGAFVIGFVISLFLLPCTSGPYIVILGLLARTTTRASALMWLLVYNVIFVLPMVAITAAVYLGLTTAAKAERWRSRHLRLLHLVAGAVILLLGVGMLTTLWLGKV